MSPRDKKQLKIGGSKNKFNKLKKYIRNGKKWRNSASP
jgi:hypothetical protein